MAPGDEEGEGQGDRDARCYRGEDDVEPDGFFIGSQSSRLRFEVAIEPA